MFQIPSADRVRVHRVYADDACRLVLTSDARLVCPVHSGVARPRSRRRCEIRSFHLCQVCMREQVPRRNFKDMQRFTCADCLDLDREVAAASGVGPLTGIVQKESVTRRGAAHVTLAFPDLWQSAVEAGLAVFVLDENAPYWGAETRFDGSVRAGDSPDPSVRFTWLVDWQQVPFDSSTRRERYLAWAKAVSPASAVAAAAGESS